VTVSKVHFIGLLVGVLMVSVCLDLYALYRVYALAQQGAQSHAVNCAYRANVEHQISDSKAYLAATPAERARQFGALGKIPPSTIERGLHLQEATLASLRGLTCGGR
jgi:hypothetical protein